MPAAVKFRRTHEVTRGIRQDMARSQFGTARPRVQIPVPDQPARRAFRLMKCPGFDGLGVSWIKMARKPKRFATSGGAWGKRI